jgi:hypothetical protein
VSFFFVLRLAIELRLWLIMQSISPCILAAYLPHGINPARSKLTSMQR